jgi:hypothetical protein
MQRGTIAVMNLLSHHAWLYAGTKHHLDEVYALLEQSGITAHGNPDVRTHIHDVVGIDDVRAFLELSHHHPVRDERTISILVGATYTREAQNALLKTIEEPAAHALYILVTPHPHQLLPTIRSRTHTLPHTSRIFYESEAKTFLKASSKDRLDTIKDLLGTSSDDRDVHTLHAFLDAVERLSAGQVHTAGEREGIRALYDAKRALYEPGAAVKPLLETAALLVPLLR